MDKILWTYMEKDTGGIIISYGSVYRDSPPKEGYVFKDESIGSSFLISEVKEVAQGSFVLYVECADS